MVHNFIKAGKLPGVKADDISEFFDQVIGLAEMFRLKPGMPARVDRRKNRDFDVPQTPRDPCGEVIVHDDQVKVRLALLDFFQDAFDAIDFNNLARGGFHFHGAGGWAQKEGSLIKKVAILAVKPALVMISCRMRTFSKYQVLRVCSSATIKILVALGTRVRMAFLMRAFSVRQTMFTEIIEARGKKIGVNHRDLKTGVTDIHRCVKRSVESFHWTKAIDGFVPVGAGCRGHRWLARNFD